MDAAVGIVTIYRSLVMAMILVSSSNLAGCLRYCRSLRCPSALVQRWTAVEAASYAYGSDNGEMPRTGRWWQLLDDNERCGGHRDGFTDALSWRWYWYHRETWRAAWGAVNHCDVHRHWCSDGQWLKPRRAIMRMGDENAREPGWLVSSHGIFLTKQEGNVAQCDADITKYNRLDFF